MLINININFKKTNKIKLTNLIILINLIIIFNFNLNSINFNITINPQYLITTINTFKNCTYIIFYILTLILIRLNFIILKIKQN